MLAVCLLASLAALVPTPTSVISSARRPPAGLQMLAPRGGASRWRASTPALVQGGSLRTWSCRAPWVERVQVVLSTQGRPLDADVELWHGPDHTPIKMRVYVEDGRARPVRAVLEAPRGSTTVGIRNRGSLEFPFAAEVVAEGVDAPSADCLDAAAPLQGGAMRTYPLDPAVASVQVLLQTDGRPLHARLEVLQGPNHNKQVVELFSEDGRDRPFFGVLETPGAGHVVRVINIAPVEFLMRASVVAHSRDVDRPASPVVGGW